MNPPALTNKELEDKLGHNHGQPISISGRCHANSPMIVLFDSDSSTLLLICPTCSTAIARIAVAKTEVH